MGRPSRAKDHARKALIARARGPRGRYVLSP